jgi:protein arginine kinase activator
MARPEQCSGCNKKTTIHFTQIINNKVYKLDMCEDCPLKKEVIDPGNFSLTDIFKSGKETVIKQEQEDTVCKTCGMTQVEFEKRGRLGCPECYTYFGAAIQTIAKDMHYGITHKGKQPTLAVKRVDLNHQVSGMREELDIAIDAEDFEQAAILRDKIIEIEAKLGKLTQTS